MTQDPNDLESALRETKAELAQVKREAQERIIAWGQRVSELEQALTEANEVLSLIDIGERDCISAPEDKRVRELCEWIGYGAVMDSAARLWRRKDPIGAFTSGPCVSTVKDTLNLVHAALERNSDG
jgi:hypothetical protein